MVTGPGPPLPWYATPLARTWACPAPSRSAAAFHLLLPDYSVTPLIDVPSLAVSLAVGRVLVKDESSRLDLPSFKALGASWAVHQLLVTWAGLAALPGPHDLPALRRLAAARPRLMLVTATDGNHGRAVARMARLVGAAARVFVPAAVTAQAVAAIATEGAEVVTVPGDYDRAVAAAARSARGQPGAALIQDTAWPGYEQVPGWIAEGYATLFAELDGQLPGAGPPDLVVVPVGVGSLAQAAVAHYRGGGHGVGTALLAVEPDTAACALASLRAGRPVTVRTGNTVMAGLNCGTVSALGWPYLAGGLDAAVAVTDQQARQAVADLATAGISAGPSGAASLAGARAAVTGPGSAERRATLALGPAATVVLLSTEAALPSC
jgi:diaminopropionate ammonia-lyase